MVVHGQKETTTRAGNLGPRVESRYPEYLGPPQFFLGFNVGHIGFLGGLALLVGSLAYSERRMVHGYMWPQGR